MTRWRRWRLPRLLWRPLRCILLQLRLVVLRLPTADPRLLPLAARAPLLVDEPHGLLDVACKQTVGVAHLYQLRVVHCENDVRDPLGVRRVDELDLGVEVSAES